jgi:hypothetical protein
MQECWVALVYDWGDNGLPLGKTHATKVLAAVKAVLLAEATERAAISREVDPIIAALDEAELRRLHRVLDRLIPEELPA